MKTFLNNNQNAAITAGTVLSIIAITAFVMMANHFGFQVH
jgi:hypothetical protein